MRTRKPRRAARISPPDGSMIAMLGLVMITFLALSLASWIFTDPVSPQTREPRPTGEPLAQTETPSPSIENKDAQSLSTYRSKDPFRELLQTADETSDGTGSGTDDGSGGSGSGTPSPTSTPTPTPSPTPATNPPSSGGPGVRVPGGGTDGPAGGSGGPGGVGFGEDLRRRGGDRLGDDRGGGFDDGRRGGRGGRPQPGAGGGQLPDSGGGALPYTGGALPGSY